IRRPQLFSDLLEVTKADPDKLRGILDALRRDGVSFIVPSWKEPIKDDTTIDISHESLIRQSGTLQGWLREEAEAARTDRRLEGSDKWWGQAQRDRSALATMPFLGVAGAWKEKERPNASWAARYGDNFPLAMEFLDQSLKAEKDRLVEAERRREEDARQA